MNILFIFDADIKIPKLRSLPVASGDKILVLPLTLKAVANKAVREICEKTGCSIEIIDIADKINFFADKVRDKYLKFIAELPDRIRWRGKNLKEIFAIDEHTSLWWLSLVAEKNTYKSDVLFKFVQLEMIVDAVKSGKIDKIIYGAGSKRLHKALHEYSVKNGIEYIKLTAFAGKNWRVNFKNAGIMFYFRHLTILACFAFLEFLKTVRIKWRFSLLKRRQYDNAPMIVSYYPNIDIFSAKNGILKNNFWVNLQESLEERNGNITWIFIYTPNNSLQFKVAMDYAAGFIRKGYSIFFLEEFSSIPKQMSALFGIIAGGIKFIRLEKSIRAAHIIDDYNFYELFREDWYSSFVGAKGYSGILYYEIFSSIFTKTGPVKCLYPCEMHAWERALIYAGKSVNKDMHLFAYQPGTISRMLLNYFNHPSEVSGNGTYPMPRPDKVICNGDLPFRYMIESGWPDKDLIVGEAIRYSYLKRHMENRYAKKRVILLALSISPEENNSILTFANEALKDMRDIEVWVKPHPFLDIKRVLEVAGLQEKEFRFKIKKDPIEGLLPDAQTAIVGESGTCIEALAFGCEVIIISSPEWINMSPLMQEKSGMIRKVFSAGELKRVVMEIMSKKYEPEAVRKESLRIINDFFYFNPDSNVPSRMLELLKEKA